MKLSAAARHAVRLVLEVHRRTEQNRPVALREVSGATGISARFLEQLAMALKAHALLRGVCGRHGGYLLARPAAEITIGDVLRAIGGPIDPAACAADESACMSTSLCECRLMWRLLGQRIRAVLDGCTIADLADDEWVASMRELVAEDEGCHRGRRAARRAPWQRAHPG